MEMGNLNASGKRVIYKQCVYTFLANMYFPFLSLSIIILRSDKTRIPDV